MKKVCHLFSSVGKTECRRDGRSGNLCHKGLGCKNYCLISISCQISVFNRVVSKYLFSIKRSANKALALALVKYLLSCRVAPDSPAVQFPFGLRPICETCSNVRLWDLSQSKITKDLTISHLGLAVMSDYRISCNLRLRRTSQSDTLRRLLCQITESSLI